MVSQADGRYDTIWNQMIERVVCTP